MALLVIAVGLFLAGGLGALAAYRSPRWSTALAVTGTLAGGIAGLVPALGVLLHGGSVSLRLAWDVPYGALFIEIDALSALFLVPILGVCALAAVYGSEYLLSYRGSKTLACPWFFYNLLVASMVLVVVARNAVLFLMAWEVMSLASFFLVTFDDEKESVREAGWTYLVATHLGTAVLLVLFIGLGREAGSLDFDRFRAIGSLAAQSAGLLFVLAVVGFGTKAGFMPLHVWLPEAHPAAPSHVSAVMSGVMIKTGIYGLFRVLTFLGAPPAWWGWLLIGVGLSSGVLGVLFALAQHDLKRLLAYHSVENIGIIALGMGAGLLGVSYGSPCLAVLSLGGALLHVLNHAIFKGLLFLGAGAVLHATGTTEIDHLGGLLKRMPWTGVAFLTGAVAISGLPPLCGFVSEFLVYLGAFHGVTSLAGAPTVALLSVITGLALIGGLATACFTKAFGIVFLGEPRSEHGAHAHEPGLAMRIPMLLLAAGCVLIALFAPAVTQVLAGALEPATGLASAAVQEQLAASAGPLSLVVLVTLGLAGLVVVLVGLRAWLLAGREVREGVTWDCGYARPAPRMQYTASSFAQPLTDLFGLFLKTRRRFSPPEGLFPAGAFLATETPDAWHERLYRPAFAAIGWGLSQLRWLQHGRVQLYVLYIGVVLLFLLVWKLG